MKQKRNTCWLTLFKATNHDVKPEDVNKVMKRKFLNGISADLHHNVFIFCNTPLDDSFGHQDLLKAIRDTHLHLTAIKKPVVPAPDDSIFHTDSRSTCQPTQVSINAAVNALTPVVMSDDSTLNTVLSLTKSLINKSGLVNNASKNRRIRLIYSVIRLNDFHVVVDSGLSPAGHSAEQHMLSLNESLAGQHRRTLSLQRYDATTAMSSIISSRIVFG